MFDPVGTLGMRIATTSSTAAVQAAPADTSPERHFSSVGRFSVCVFEKPGPVVTSRT